MLTCEQMLRAVISETRISQKQIARLAGVHYRTIQYILDGPTADPRYTTGKTIENLYNVFVRDRRVVGAEAEAAEAHDG